MIPFGDLRRCYERLRPEIDGAVADVLSDGRFILGERVAAFEDRFARYCEVEHAVGVGCGTDAIALALRAVGVEPGDEVITTPLSAAFTALAISQIGAEPVFADIDDQSLTIDPAAVEAAITARTTAIVPVHLYGRAADMQPLLAIARAHDLAVVEDAAQAHGARCLGRRVGGLAHAAAFSFYPSKNLGAFGDGGAVTTDDPGVARSVRILRDGGQTDRYRHDQLGVNSRLDELQAAILSVRLRHLDTDNERRREIAGRYQEAVADSGRLRGPLAADAASNAYHLFVVRSSDRPRLVEHLRAFGVASAVHYPTPLHLQPAFGGAERSGELPGAERATAEVLSLPLFPELREDEIATICEAIRALSTDPDGPSPHLRHRTRSGK